MHKGPNLGGVRHFTNNTNENAQKNVRYSHSVYLTQTPKKIQWIIIVVQQNNVR